GLDALETVGLDLAITTSTFEGVTALQAPALHEIGLDLALTDVAGLTKVDLGALTKLGGRIRISGLPSLHEVDIVGSAELQSDLEISRCSGPLTLTLHDVQRVGGSLLLSDDGDLTVSAPHLVAVVGSLRMTEVTLRAFDAPMLAGIEQDLELQA